MCSWTCQFVCNVLLCRSFVVHVDYGFMEIFWVQVILRAPLAFWAYVRELTLGMGSTSGMMISYNIISLMP